MLKITEKLRPFSHQPGTKCLVPRSDWIVEVYPVLLRIGGLAFPIRMTGPVKEFTIQMDLERDCAWVWGIAKEGYFRYKLSAEEIGLTLFIDRCPKTGLGIGSHTLKAKEKILLLSGGQFMAQATNERLFLGNAKAQDWDQVRRRNLTCEWAPILFALAQKVPVKGDVHGGPLTLLDKPHEFFPAAFEGILVPHLVDPFHQGLFSEDAHGNPLALLTKLFHKIRSYLLEDNRILPALPSDWHCGRSLHLQSRYGPIDLEWTKGTIRKMILHADRSENATFIFPKAIQSFRLNGERMERQRSFSIESGKKYVLDRFKK